MRKLLQRPAEWLAPHKIYNSASKILYDNINIIAFNRPAYFEEVLRSIVIQKVDYSAKSVHIWIDGYRGSLDEARSKPDLTEEVIRLAEKYMPSAVLHRFLDNIGIARIYQEAEKLCCSSSQAPYALFFEEDLVLGPSYMEALELLMKWASDRDDIAIVTAHGYVHEYLAESRHFLELPPGLYYVHSLWANAVKIQHIRERQPFMDNYIKLIDSAKYYCRNHEAIREYFCDHGLRFIHGTSQDYAKHAALWAFGKCAVTISIKLSKYIGREGEHSDEALFEILGYNNSEVANFDPRLYKRLLPDCVDYTSLKALRLLELKTIMLAGYLERLEGLTQALAAERLSREATEAAKAELVQTLTHYKTENQALRSSTSWRATAPLRSVSNAVRRLRPIRQGRLADPSKKPKTLSVEKSESTQDADLPTSPSALPFAMVIKMEDINNCGMPVQFLGGRSRLASCTGVKLIDEERLVACNLVGQRMYLVRFNLDSGRYDIEDCIPTRFGDEDVCTDLIDGDNRGRFATSNCGHCSVSIYRLKENRLHFEKDLPLPESEPKFCHGVKFVPPDNNIICATTTFNERSVYFLRIASGEIIYKFRDGEWRPKDVCFLDGSRAVVIYTYGTPSFGEAAPYDSKASLIALDLATRRHEVISELMIDGHVDCCRVLGERLYITNGTRNSVMIVQFKQDELTLDGELLGYSFPHGIDVTPNLLAVTNYGTNSIALTKLG